MNLERRVREGLTDAEHLLDEAPIPGFEAKSQSRPGLTGTLAIVALATAGMIGLALTWPDGEVSAGQTTTTTFYHPEFTPPTVPAYDSGVATKVLGRNDTDDVTDLYDGLEGHYESVGPTIDITVESCSLVGPDQWLVEGSVAVPGGGHATVIIEVMPGNPIPEGVFTDVVLGQDPLRVEFSGSGRFAIHNDKLRRDDSGEFSWFGTAGLFAHCTIWVSSSSAPVQVNGNRLGGTVPAVTSEDPVTWKAPSDSIQGLGIGARLDDPNDPKVSWAAFARLHPSLSQESLWVPTDPLLPITGVYRSGACETVIIKDERVQVQLLSRCSTEGRLQVPSYPPGMAPEVEGFGPRQWDGAFALMAERDGWTIFVQMEHGVPVDMDLLARTANSLTRYRNLMVEGRKVPGADADLDRAISTALSEAGAEERGRHQLPDGRIAVVALGWEEDSWGRIPMKMDFVTERRQDVWVVEGGGSSSGDCIFGSGSYVMTWLAWDPTWTFQFKEAAWVNPGSDPQWVDLPTSNGVAWLEGAFPHGHTRAVDSDGRVVACTWEGHLEPGEEWSPFQSPNQVWDLPVTVTPAAGLSDGATVTVSGERFPAESNLDIRVCRMTDPARPDIAACTSHEAAGASWARVGSDGRFTTSLMVPVTFTDDWEVPIDCRIDRCVVRVMHPIGGAIRGGTAPITFGN